MVSATFSQPKVTGFLDKELPASGAKRKAPTEEIQSNHQHAMAAFDDAGYEVRYQIVNPLAQGIPASRPRIHYQGLCRSKQPNLNPVVAMDSVLDSWKQLNEKCVVNHKLSDYLFDEDDLHTEPEVADNFPCPLSSAQKTPTGRKWETIHEEFKRSLKVPGCFIFVGGWVQFVGPCHLFNIGDR